MILMSIILKRNREIDIYIYITKGKERKELERKREILLLRLTSSHLPLSPKKKPILKLSCVICLHYIKELQELKIRNISK